MVATFLVKYLLVIHRRLVRFVFARYLHSESGTRSRDGTQNSYAETFLQEFLEFFAGWSRAVPLVGRTLFIDLYNSLRIAFSQGGAGVVYHQYSGSSALVFDVLFYMIGNLPAGVNHTVSWVLTNGSGALFDYAVLE
jgi:hypothetical protein